MADEMRTRLDSLYVQATDRGTVRMHADAASACARWCGPETTHHQVEQFIERQISCLDGLTDSLSCEVRNSWHWLGLQVGTAPVVVPAPARARRFGFAGRPVLAPRGGLATA